jgi:hypothetical protein
MQRAKMVLGRGTEAVNRVPSNVLHSDWLVKFPDMLTGFFRDFSQVDQREFRAVS